MTQTGAKLRIKYGLVNPPTDDEARLWSRRVEDLIAQGLGLEEAGRQAARELWDVDRLLFRTQAETIAALLAEIRKK